MRPEPSVIFEGIEIEHRFIWLTNPNFSLSGSSAVNVNGGAIALGHPLGCTGAKLTVQIMNELKKREQRYGVVTMCVGTGQAAAGVIERF